MDLGYRVLRNFWWAMGVLVMRANWSINAGAGLMNLFSMVLFQKQSPVMGSVVGHPPGVVGDQPVDQQAGQGATSPRTSKPARGRRASSCAYG